MIATNSFAPRTKTLGLNHKLVKPNSLINCFRDFNKKVITKPNKTKTNQQETVSVERSPSIISNRTFDKINIRNETTKTRPRVFVEKYSTRVNKPDLDKNKVLPCFVNLNPFIDLDDKVEQIDMSSKDKT